MSTNFYFKNGDKEIHIGKSCDCGQFCAKCGISLISSATDGYLSKKVVYGNDAVNYGCNEVRLDVCPICNSTEHVIFGSSFSWAVSPENFHKHLHVEKFLIVDEYNAVYTAEKFIKEIQETSIFRFDAVGENFC